MFIRFTRESIAVHQATGIANPENPNAPLMLNIFRTHSNAGIYKVYSKKAFGEYYSEGSKKSISRRKWTPEMKAFLQEKLAVTPKAPYIFKVTIVGWIVVLILIGIFAMIAYQEAQPPAAKPASYVAMENKLQVGDVFFGNVEIHKQKGNPVGTKVSFGWFKVTDIKGDDYFLSPSTEVSNHAQPKESMNSTDFEQQSLPAIKITEQTGYNLRFKSSDGLIDAYFTDKK